MQKMNIGLNNQDKNEMKLYVTKERGQVLIFVFFISIYLVLDF